MLSKKNKLLKLVVILSISYWSSLSAPFSPFAQFRAFLRSSRNSTPFEALAELTPLRLYRILTRKVKAGWIKLLPSLFVGSA